MLPIELAQSALARSAQPNVTPVNRVTGVAEVEGGNEESMLDRSAPQRVAEMGAGAPAGDAVTGRSRRVTASPEGDSTRLSSRALPRPVVSEDERLRRASAAANLLAPEAVESAAPQASAVDAARKGSAQSATPRSTESAGAAQAAERIARRSVGTAAYPPSQKAIASGEAEPPRILMPPPPFPPEPPRPSLAAEPPKVRKDLGVGAGMEVRLPGVGAGSVVRPASLETRSVVTEEAGRRESARAGRPGAARIAGDDGSTTATLNRGTAAAAEAQGGRNAPSGTGVASRSGSAEVAVQEMRNPPGSAAKPTAGAAAKQASEVRPSRAFAARLTGDGDGGATQAVLNRGTAAAGEAQRGSNAPVGTGIASRSGSAEVAMQEMRASGSAGGPVGARPSRGAAAAASAEKPEMRTEPAAVVVPSGSRVESPDALASGAAAPVQARDAQSAAAAAYRKTASQATGGLGSTTTAFGV
jgi:hypothetical protein